MNQRVAKIGRPPAGEIEKRKQTILEVATRLFIADGYDKTTLAEIGRQAGVTKRTIYEHIGDKDTLFRAVFIECLPQGLELHFEPRLGGRTAHEALKNLARLVLDYSLSDENINLTRMLIIEQQRFPDLVHQAVLVMTELYEQLIENALNDMVDHGLLAPCDDMEKITYYFFDIVVGSLQTQMLFGLDVRPPSEADIDWRIDIFLLGYQASEGLKRKPL